MNNTSSLIVFDIFRISADSKYIDFSFLCKQGYHFDFFQMDAWYVPDGESQFTHEIFDLTDQLFNNDPDSPYNTLDQTRWVLRIPIESAFGISEPAMF